ncbi:MAG: hypothetical protein WCT51_00005, partial [Candidatus Shapirobacteria bacterium]
MKKLTYFLLMFFLLITLFNKNILADCTNNETHKPYTVGEVSCLPSTGAVYRCTSSGWINIGSSCTTTFCPASGAMSCETLGCYNINDNSACSASCVSGDCNVYGRWCAGSSLKYCIYPPYEGTLSQNSCVSPSKAIITDTCTSCSNIGYCCKICPAAGTCLSTCSSSERTVDDGSCGTITCSHNYPTATTCPSTCSSDNRYYYTGSSCSQSTCSHNYPTA